MKYKCLILDHDDTIVNSSATIHYPSFVEYLRDYRPELADNYTFESFIVKNFHPGIVSLLRDEVGLNEEADKILKAVLNTYDTAFTHSGLMPGYVQSVDWRTKEGRPCGYNYLADNYYFLLAPYIAKGDIDHPAVVGIKK